MDKGELYRVALSYLGTYEYVPGSSEVRALDDVLTHTLRIAAAYGRWRWALKRAVLTLENGAADLPADFQEMEQCSLFRWEILGSQIIARDDRSRQTFEIVYTSSAWASECRLPDHSPEFCDGLALLLASKASVRINGNFNLAASLEERARNAFYRARLAEVRQQNSNDQGNQGKEVQHG